MNNIISLYFAHNFNDRKKFREIELQLEKELGIELYNPFYDDISRAEEMSELDSQEIDAIKRMGQFENKFNRSQESAELIVRRDLTAVAKCRGLVTIIESPSIGTTMEICNATLMKKDVYVISAKYSSHPWIKIYSTKTFLTVDDFKTYVKKTLLS